MYVKILKRIIAINIYIEDPEEKKRLKEKIYSHLEENDLDTLYRIILAR